MTDNQRTIHFSSYHKQLMFLPFSRKKLKLHSNVFHTKHIYLIIFLQTKLRTKLIQALIIYEYPTTSWTTKMTEKII